LGIKNQITYQFFYLTKMAGTYISIADGLIVCGGAGGMPENSAGAKNDILYPARFRKIKLPVS
jgi:hypothetical protein